MDTRQLTNITSIPFIGYEPKKAHSHDAAYDLMMSSKDATRFILAPGAFAMIPTELSVAIPEGYAGLVLPRSGLAAKYGVTVLNSPGLIDPGYTGEIKVVLINLGHEEFVVKNGDRVAQLMIVKTEQVMFNRVTSLDETQRGNGGFGSTGK